MSCAAISGWLPLCWSAYIASAWPAGTPESRIEAVDPVGAGAAARGGAAGAAPAADPADETWSLAADAAAATEASTGPMRMDAPRWHVAGLHERPASPGVCADVTASPSSG